MSDIFLRVLNMSVTGCFVILAVLASRLLLRKAPKKYSYALWAAAGFRLVCPVSFRSVLSLFSLRPFQSVSQTGSGMTFIPEPTVYEPAPTVNSAVDAVEQTVNSTLPTITPSIAPSVTPSPVPSVTPAATVDPIQVLLLVATVLWVLGMAVMAAVSIVNYIRLKKELRFAIRLEGNIWQSDAVRSPFILGIWKPKIYIPYGLDDQTRQTILAHEQYHLKRLDHWVKVFAFGALTLHWFNPLCHLAFHLMSRDMEMSCDEHVLAAKRIETTEYSESLLTIATNRRFPAATPLAFAETGVRERMINVLKWRKPRTWVTVTAIVLSALMLISCVANPRLSEPKVDDVTLLEFPGVKWGSTPEEVKEALNITEQQIANEWADEDGEDYYLTVKDLTFFGEKVSIASFQFRAPLGDPLRLFNVTLYLDENTNMEKMQKTLSNEYDNEGTGGYYLDYSMEPQIIDHNTETGTTEASDYILKEFKKSGDPTLWFLANNRPSGVSGSGFREAVDTILNDPDFKEFNWVSPVKGTEMFSAADFDAVKAHYSQIPHEIVQEWMEKVPLVRMSIANRSLAAALAEVNGTTDGEPSLATHNQVILDAEMLIFFTEQLEAAAKITASCKVDDVTLLEFPGVKWGSTPEEVKEALNITEKQISSEWADEDVEEYFLTVKDITFFGEKVPIAGFQFRRNPGQPYRLWRIFAYLDEAVDMDKMQETLSQAYNNEGTGEYHISYSIQEGELVEFKRATAATISSWTQSLYPELTEQIRSDPEYRTYNWVCSAKGTDIISPECLEWLKARGEKVYYEGAIATPGAVTEEWFEKKPMVHMGIATRTLNALRAETGETDDEELALTTHNIVELDAGSLVWIMELEERFLREGAAANVDRRMLEFPGVKWNATPEEVKAALNIKDEQIVTENQSSSDASSMEVFYLGVTDISFFGEDVHHAKFTFVRYAGYDTFGLESVELFYPDETDMAVIGETLSNIYGASSKALSITRYRISDGKVQPYTQAASFTGKDVSEATKWWPSTAKGTEVLPVDVQENIISIFTDPESHNPASREVVLDYLDLDPLVILYCTDTAGEDNYDSPYYTSNKVDFSASYYVDYIQRFGQ